MESPNILSKGAIAHRLEVQLACTKLAEMETEYQRRSSPQAKDRHTKTDARRAHEAILAHRRSIFCYSLVYAYRFIWSGTIPGEHDFRYIPDFYWELDYMRCRVRRPKRHLVMVGRGYGKTELVITETIQDLMFLPNEQTGIVSADLKLSTKETGLVRHILDTHAGIRELFADRLWDNPNAEADLWRTDSLTIRRQSMSKDPSLSAMSMDRNDTGAHFHRLKVDDCVTIENANTSDQREKVKEQLAMMWKLLVAPVDTRDALVVGTPYHYEDAYQAMIEDEKWVKTIIPCAVYPNTDGSGGFEPWDGIDDPDREPISIFPEIYPMEALRAMRDSSDPREVMVFYSQMLLKPTAGENAIFVPAMFEHPWDETEEEETRIRKKPLFYFMAVDAAAGVGPRSDYTAITTAGFDKDRIGYAWEISKGRWHQDGIIREAVRHAVEFGPKFILWEEVAFSSRDREAFEAAAAKAGIHCPVIPVHRSKRSKESRIEGDLRHQGFRHFLQTGKCRFRRCHQPHIQEILRYPNAHDDVLDTLSDIFEKAYPGPATEAELIRSHRPTRSADYQRITYHGLY